MSNIKTPLYYAYKCSHPVPTIHWAACPHCCHGMGQSHWPGRKTFFDDNGCARGWTALYVTEDQVIGMVRRGTHRFCGYCCRDLWAAARKRA